jgi:hypothetical protein
VSSDNIPDVYEQRATKMAVNAGVGAALSSSAGSAALAYVGLGAFAGPIGALAGLAIGALMGGGKEHGKAIPKDVKKQTKLLESGDPNQVSKALETAGRRLSNWGTCKSKGSGCLPHREGTLQALASHGVVVPQICVERGGKECTAQFGDVTAAYMAARFREGEEPMSWQQLSSTSLPTFKLTDMGGIDYGAPTSTAPGGSSGWAGALLDLTKLGVTAYASERQAKAAEEQRKAVVAATGQMARDAAFVAGQTPQTPGSAVVPGREGATWDPALALALALGTGAGSDGDRSGSTVVVPGASASVSPLLLAAVGAVGLLLYLRS